MGEIAQGKQLLLRLQKVRYPFACEERKSADFFHRRRRSPMSPSPSAFASVPSTTSSQADPCVFRSALNQLKVDDKAREAKKSTEFSTFLSLRASHLVADDSQRGCIPSLLKREEITRRPNSSRLGSPRWLRRSSKAPRSRRSYPSHPLPILPSHPSLASIPSSVLYLGVTSTYVAFLSSAQSKRELPTALLHPPRDRKSVV